MPVARRLVWVFLHPIEKLDEQEIQLRQHLMNHPVLQHACELVHDFQRMVRKREAQKFAA